MRAGTLWIVIPTYNEAENLTRLVPVLEAKLVGRACQILIVDDASPDATESVVAQLRRRYDNVTLYRRSAKRGLGSALRDGLMHALSAPECDLICTMDADFSHDPAELSKLLAASERAAFVQGSRYVRGGRILNWPWHRRVLSWGINQICRVLGSRLREHTTNYRVYDRRAATEAIKMSDAGGFEWIISSGLAVEAAGLPVTEVPITFKDREVGTSKLSPAALSRYGPFVIRLVGARLAQFWHRMALRLRRRSGIDAK